VVGGPAWSGVQCSLGSRVLGRVQGGLGSRVVAGSGVVGRVQRGAVGPAWRRGSWEIVGLDVDAIARVARALAYQYTGMHVCTYAHMQVCVLAVWTPGRLAVWTSSCLAVWTSSCLAVWTSSCLAVWTALGGRLPMARLDLSLELGSSGLAKKKFSFFRQRA